MPLKIEEIQRLVGVLVMENWALQQELLALKAPKPAEPEIEKDAPDS